MWTEIDSRAHIMRKLGLSTRAELARCALEHDLLDSRPRDSVSLAARFLGQLRIRDRCRPRWLSTSAFR